VRTPCLVWALEEGEIGVWGGTLDAERQAMLDEVREALSLSPSERPAALFGLGEESAAQGIR
jgi:hypothetical protein